MSNDNRVLSVTAVSADSVTISFTDQDGNSHTLTLPKTSFKGQAQWAARKIASGGGYTPTYGTKERLDWADRLRKEIERQSASVS